MNESNFTSRQWEAIRHIRNSLIHGGGTPSVRKLMAAMGYKSPRSAHEVLEQLEQKGVIQRNSDGDYQLVGDPELGSSHAQTVNVPLVGTAACGSAILAEQNIEGYIPVSTSIAKSGGQYFLLRAKGDSMDKAGINDGDFVLVRKQSVAEPGNRVVALIDNEATIKEFRLSEGAVLLTPRSTNSKHKPIILEENFQIQGVVVTVLPGTGLFE